MKTPINKSCPHCQQPFQLRRKNQFYCSVECRIDANNELAKGRYAHFKKEAPNLAPIRNELSKIKAHLASLIVDLTEVKEVDNHIRYAGRSYKRGTKIGRIKLGVSLFPGGALLVPGDKIIYRTTRANTTDNYWEYTLEQ